MDQDRLDKALAGICPAVKFLRETDSTNRVALEWAKKGAPEGAIVVADYQTSGRGRFDRSWFAPHGESLLFSLILRPRCSPEQCPLVNLAAAVALCRTIHSDGLAPTVKWPNDVMIAGRKTAGILAESLQVRPEAGENAGLCLVVGVGINVNVEHFPPDLSETATSLRRETGRRIDRSDLLRRFLDHLSDLYGSFPEGIVEAYMGWSDVLGRPIELRQGKNTIQTRAQAIDGLGNLVLDTGQIVSEGDVTYRGGPKT